MITITSKANEDTSKELNNHIKALSHDMLTKDQSPGKGTAHFDKIPYFLKNKHNLASTFMIL